MERAIPDVPSVNLIEEEGVDEAAEVAVVEGGDMGNKNASATIAPSSR